MIKNISAIETALGLKAGEFDAMYKDAAEKEIDLSGLSIMKKDEFDTRIKNVKEEAGIAAVEIAVKDARAKYNLDFTGKNIDNFAVALKTKALADAKIEPDKKVSELQSDLEKMRGNATEWENKYKTFETTVKQKENDRTKRDAVLKKIPDNLLLSKEDALNLFFAKNNVELSETGGLLFKRGDQILKNEKTLNPLTIDEVMPDFVAPYLKPATGGGGGTDNPGQSKPGSFVRFCEEMNQAGVREGSMKFNEEMQKRIKEKTLTM